MQLIGLATTVVVLLTSIWVYRDVNKLGVYVEGVGPNGWLILCLVLWILAFPYYLLIRGKAVKRIQNEANRHKWQFGK